MVSLPASVATTPGALPLDKLREDRCPSRLRLEVHRPRLYFPGAQYRDPSGNAEPRNIISIMFQRAAFQLS